MKALAYQDLTVLLLFLSFGLFQSPSIGRHLRLPVRLQGLVKELEKDSHQEVCDAVVHIGADSNQRWFLPGRELAHDDRVQPPPRKVAERTGLVAAGHECSNAGRQVAGIGVVLHRVDTW